MGVRVVVFAKERNNGNGINIYSKYTMASFCSWCTIRLYFEEGKMKFFWFIVLITFVTVGAGLFNALYMLGAVR